MSAPAVSVGVTATAEIIERPEGALVILRVGPWTLPMTDQQLQCMDRMIARARARALPFCSIVDDERRECVAWVVEPVPAVAVVATGVSA